MCGENFNRQLYLLNVWLNFLKSIDYMYKLKLFFWVHRLIFGLRNMILVSKSSKLYSNNFPLYTFVINKCCLKFCDLCTKLWSLNNIKSHTLCWIWSCFGSLSWAWNPFNDCQNLEIKKISFLSETNYNYFNIW